jgi:hypothetical protein
VQQDKQTRQRVRRSEDEKRGLLDAWKKSGLSARAFGVREGVKTSCLWRWKRASGAKVSAREAKPRPSITFAPVQVTKSAPRSSATSEIVQVEVVLGRDLRVRVFEGADIVQVGRLIHALIGGAAC